MSCLKEKEKEEEKVLLIGLLGHLPAISSDYADDDMMRQRAWC